jgi:hypothetical protein
MKVEVLNIAMLLGLRYSVLVVSLFNMLGMNLTLVRVLRSNVTKMLAL